ncbi:bifunctional 2-polyprenyl-6-hydroxyphenol methylase/3-demethylubiquinol 3-O-methyltransferase UbiG [Thioalkalivibrio sp. XN8]|uniref:bifunctional 2-polyprenyl-6-hydroxyphenol methylase/3-demethylubiquinol 3-O-methyltransferase UbiG n=1 Tax=Thioalkalivibrio sp. XN8 TaxID=2712863 RepID=UPI0013ECF8F6|nr:bifunctional 2-polyprenyl-6-hydroxyphenol methylase/3-demethylubiquinol 3-O-methyltransferase UbiG [Thioalkalivibrio sp. XN8]NGP54603.1 bifunctional 2-polyprenyl-6-hydroxyphenol methylase/3-demethylubiquinol 3-O-methyltransferase UbiG [Thioalkalivibrio sp. XN8]
MNETSTANVDAAEIARFEALADRWWDPEGDFKPLHDINPARLEYIDERVALAGKRVLDIGCGGGILAESMARKGATVTAIDMAEAPLAVARIHGRESGLELEYLKCTAEEHATARPAAYDVVTCLEMIEHVPDPSLVVAACHALVRPGGQVFFSTINRNPKAWVMAIFGAEYVLRLLPRGTHEYGKLVRPSELADWMRAAGLELNEFTGMHYNPFTRSCTLGGNVDVNYLAHGRRPEQA